MKPSAANANLAFATIALAISFAVWGMISPLAKTFQSSLHLTEQQAWLLIAVPVILGSIIRLPMGMMTDRFGGRIVFGLLLVFIALPAYMLSLANTFQQLLTWGLLLGMAGTSFSVGAGYTSKWFPAEKQGLALGVYGLGNIGTSIALFCIPLLSGFLGGWQMTYKVFAIVSLVYGIFYLLCARNAPVQTQPKSFGAMLQLLAKQPLAWLLSLFYFVTFGGFVALSIGLPKLLQEIFHLTKEDAGLRVAGFVVVATLMRPIGGALSDKIGGAKLLMGVFAGTAVLALGMISSNIVPFTIGALGVAALIGLGNGGVFKLVPQYFAKDTGAVTGLVGAMGGVGGFFPPILLGVIKMQTGSYALGFILLSVFCVICLVLNYGILLKPKKPGEIGSAPRGAESPA